MKLLASLVLTALSLLEGFSFAQTGSPHSEPTETLASTLDDTLPAEAKESHIPGAVLVLVQDGQIVLSRTFGFADREREEPMRADTLLRVGSVSKPVTATAVLHLVQSGRIGLHEDLQPILADLPIEPPLSQPLTLHHLLTHTAGFSESLFGQHVSAAADFVDLSAYLKRRLPPRFIEPGQVIAYNDHHTTIAGYVVERVTGRPFDDYVRQNLFEPLAMHSSTFKQTDLPAELTRRLAKAYRWHDGRFEPYARDYVLTWPAAGLYTTAEDMARYLIGLLDCDGRVLSQAMCATQKERQFAHHPRLPGRAYGFAEGEHGSLRVLYKDGQATGFNARLVLIPEKRLGMFVAHNLSILGSFGRFLPAARFNRKLTEQVLQKLWPVDDSGDHSLPSAAAGTGSSHSLYEGDYRNVVAARHSWEKIITMMDDVHVEAGPAGLDFGFGSYVEIEPGLFQWHKGGPSYRAFRIVDGRPTHLFIGGGAYERIPWWASSRTTRRLLPTFVLGFLAATFVYAVRWFRNFSDHPAAAGLVMFVSYLFFLAGFGLVFGTTDVQTLFKGPPPLLTLVLAFPLMGLAAMGVLVFKRIRRGWKDRLKVALDVAAVAIGVAFLGWLHYWNLLGFKF